MALQTLNHQIQTVLLNKAIDNFDFESVVQAFEGSQRAIIFALNFDTNKIDVITEEYWQYDFYANPVYIYTETTEPERFQSAGKKYSWHLRQKFKLILNEYIQAVVAGEPKNTQHVFNPYHFDPALSIQYILFSGKETGIYKVGLSNTSEELLSRPNHWLHQETVVRFLTEQKEPITRLISDYRKEDKGAIFSFHYIIHKLFRYVKLFRFDSDDQTLALIKETLMVAVQTSNTVYFLQEVLGCDSPERVYHRLRQLDFTHDERETLVEHIILVQMRDNDVYQKELVVRPEDITINPYYQAIQRAIQGKRKVLRRINYQNISRYSAIGHTDNLHYIQRGFYDFDLIDIEGYDGEYNEHYKNKNDTYCSIKQLFKWLVHFYNKIGKQLSIKEKFSILFKKQDRAYLMMQKLFANTYISSELIQLVESYEDGLLTDCDGQINVHSNERMELFFQALKDNENPYEDALVVYF